MIVHFSDPTPKTVNRLVLPNPISERKTMYASFYHNSNHSYSVLRYALQECIQRSSDLANAKAFFLNVMGTSKVLKKNCHQSLEMRVIVDHMIEVIEPDFQSPLSEHTDELPEIDLDRILTEIAIEILLTQGKAQFNSGN